jgi:methionine sulfoxide reductase heme-binding subunit
VNQPNRAAVEPGAATPTPDLEIRGPVADVLSLAAAGLVGCAIATFLASQLITDQPMPDNVTLIMWYAIRVAGILAYLTLWLATISGLCISGGLFPKWGAVLLPVHQLADLALSLALLHAALLLGDRYAGFTPESLVVPFRATYEPVWTGLGILALYLGAVVFWSVEIRPKIGYARWRALHYLAFVVYAFALAHGLFAGTDRETAPLRLMYLTTGGAVIGLGILRTVALRRKPRKAEAPHRVAAARKTPITP